MASSHEQLLPPAVHRDLNDRYYTIALAFCESLIKDRKAAEQMAQAVLSELEAQEWSLKTRQGVEHQLFIRLRDHCLAYLRSADKDQLLRQLGAAKAATNRLADSSTERVTRGSFLSVMNQFLSKVAALF